MNSTPETWPKAVTAGKTFAKDVLVRFSDCDPAGIVFYPKYFEMFNNLVEDWFREELQLPFSEIVSRRGWGLPTVHLEVDFKASSSYGETVRCELRVQSAGHSSITLAIDLSGSDATVRVKSKIVLVLIDRASMTAIAFPDAMRERLEAFGVTR
ncbi:MAG: thioesterase family protein [Candidatus Acidiferrales bacterium]